MPVAAMSCSMTPSAMPSPADWSTGSSRSPAANTLALLLQELASQATPPAGRAFRQADACRRLRGKLLLGQVAHGPLETFDGERVHVVFGELLDPLGRGGHLPGAFRLRVQPH